ncbi:F-box only protein 6-like [Arctopsyche grandis]|uniref:F-box only protein 6-like n=1 Tax=Arctopsyche grandis TaxID=121162 RepID=UPI00406D7AB9
MGQKNAGMSGNPSTTAPVELSSEPPPNIPPNNGCVLSDTYLPDEVIIRILSFVDKKTLVKKCKFVCKKWHELIKRGVWKVKVERKYHKEFSKLKLQKRLPWSVYYNIIWNNSYGKNFLKNNSGQLDMKHWKIVANGGDHWKNECPPIGVPETTVDAGHKVCFATSYHRCEKKQVIELSREGISPYIMDTYQPTIFISEWYTARWDCNSYYRLHVELLNDKQEVVTNFNFDIEMRSWLDGWKEVHHSFDSYGPGVRYVVFSHVGNDLQFWSGHYGSKMACARVEIPFSTLSKLQIKHDDYINDEIIN